MVGLSVGSPQAGSSHSSLTLCPAQAKWQEQGPRVHWAQPQATGSEREASASRMHKPTQREGK